MKYLATHHAGTPRKIKEIVEIAERNPRFCIKNAGLTRFGGMIEQDFSHGGVVFHAKAEGLQTGKATFDRGLNGDRRG